MPHIEVNGVFKWRGILVNSRLVAGEAVENETTLTIQN